MNFKQHRVSNNLTQEQVAQDVGVQRTTVAMWESGKSRPRAELLPKLAKLFGCHIFEHYYTAETGGFQLFACYPDADGTAGYARTAGRWTSCCAAISTRRT